MADDPLGLHVAVRFILALIGALLIAAAALGYILGRVL